YLSEAIAPAGGRHILNVFVKARQVGGELGVPTDDVITRVEWVLLAELPHLTLYPAIAPELLRSAAADFQHEILHLGARWT
ncbi:MAG: hypothetical protein VKP62_15310, partial [Candidatus Sericytochromatia bacterium]|nr:hypothetical protein [Candidatus Sericytochromatia bacterium]